jgi:hypothetical protein
MIKTIHDYIFFFAQLSIFCNFLLDSWFICPSARLVLLLFMTCLTHFPCIFGNYLFLAQCEAHVKTIGHLLSQYCPLQFLSRVMSRQWWPRLYNKMKTMRRTNSDGMKTDLCYYYTISQRLVDDNWPTNVTTYHWISVTIRKMTHTTAQLQRRTLYCNGARYIATAHAILQRRTLLRNGIINFHLPNTVVCLDCVFCLWPFNFWHDSKNDARYCATAHAILQRRMLYCNGARYIATAHAILQRRMLYCNGARYFATA